MTAGGGDVSSLVAMSDGTVHASRVVSRRRRPRQYGTGRTCQVDGCITVLSRYTPGVLCRVHAPISYGRNRGVKH